MNEIAKTANPPATWLARNATALALIAIVISALSKLAGLHSRELWLDETYSAFVAAKPFGALLRDTLGDLHPPLFHILLWGWERLFGDSEPCLRLFCVLLNVGCMLAEFFLARRIVGKVFGAYATALFAFSPMLFVYSLEVRSYMLLILLTVLVLQMHWRILVQGESSAILIALYAVLAGTLIYVHYLGVFVLLALLLHGLLLAFQRKQRLGRLAVIVALVGALSLPGAFLLAAQHRNSARASHENVIANQRSYSLTYGGLGKLPSDANKVRSFWTKSLAAAAGVYPSKFAPVLLLSGLSIAMLSVGLAYFAGKDRDALLSLFFAATLSLGAGIFLLHLYSTRYILVLVPLLVLGFARVLQRWHAQRRAWQVAMAAGLIVFVSYAAGFARQATKPHGRPWTELVAKLQQIYRPGDEVIFSAPYAQVPFDYFARHVAFTPEETGFPVSIYSWWGEQRDVQGWGSPIVTEGDLDRFADQLLQRPSRRVWVVLYEDGYYDPHSRLQARLEASGNFVPVDLPTDVDETSEAASALRLYLFTH